MLSEFVKAYRFKNCLTQKDLANRCGLTVPTIIAIENGKVVSVKTLNKLASGVNRKYTYIASLYQKEH